jgi:hypothetical protein
MIAVATRALAIGLLVLAGLELIPIGVTLSAPPRTTDPLCGSHCLPAGVTEDPRITLIGEGDHR